MNTIARRATTLAAAAVAATVATLSLGAPANAATEMVDAHGTATITLTPDDVLSVVALQNQTMCADLALDINLDRYALGLLTSANSLNGKACELVLATCVTYVANNYASNRVKVVLAPNNTYVCSQY